MYEQTYVDFLTDTLLEYIRTGSTLLHLHNIFFFLTFIP